MQKSKNINLFAYKDYRLFLKDWYREANQRKKAVSFRSFSKKAGFRSTNFLKLIIDGERNLSEDSILKFAMALGLNKEETTFFRNLVYFNQADTHEQRDHYYQVLLRSRQYSELRPIEKNQYEYYATWYHPAVRELVVSKNFDGNFESIADRLFPKVTPAQVEKSIELLESLGFIEKAGKNRWRQSNTLVSSGAEVSSHMIFKYHKIVIDLTKEILDHVHHSRRDISTLTLGVSKDRLPQLKKKIQDFRKDILKLVSMDVEPEEVVQMNIQMFPLTVEGEKENL